MYYCWTIRPAVPADAPAIVTIIKKGFPSKLHSMFIYGCSGIVKYVAEQIAVQEYGGEAFYTVAISDNRVVGCLEMRRLQNSLFLNYIALLPEFRSLGLGGQLLINAIELAGTENHQVIKLDVLASNESAYNWYHRLGFMDEFTTLWLTYSSFITLSEAPIVLSNYAQAQACQQLYGFSQLKLISSGREFDVGRLGTKWFRLTDPNAIISPGLMAFLQRFEPNRMPLLLTKYIPDSTHLSGAQEITRTLRQTIDIKTLRQNLTRS
jgi:ribosomal protein S18 acetylase RimI-like enzyme